MHKFLRAIGFSGVRKREQLQLLIAKTIKESSEKCFTTYDEDTLLAEYILEFGENMGLTVCGEMDDEDRFVFDYIFPFMKGSNISTTERALIERHADKVSFAGVCDDNKIGISIIFYLRNRMDYIKETYKDGENPKGTTISLSGLSINGTIVMPIAKDLKATKKSAVSDKKRKKLIEEARNGSEEAIESLTLDDLDVYSAISQKIKKADVYTLVDTFFMPYGVECDMYSVMGEITKLETVINPITREEVYQMTLLINEIPVDICINKQDLFGEPMVGRRFKGTIWLQGFLNYH